MWTTKWSFYQQGLKQRNNNTTTVIQFLQQIIPSNIFESAHFLQFLAVTFSCPILFLTHFWAVIIFLSYFLAHLLFFLFLIFFSRRVHQPKWTFFLSKNENKRLLYWNDSCENRDQLPEDNWAVKRLARVVCASLRKNVKIVKKKMIC